jgi:hypothetical protein
LGSQVAQRVDHVARAHLLQPEEQGAGVVEREPRLFALVHQLCNQLTGPAITPAIDARVVPILLIGALGHVLQVADQRFVPGIGPAARAPGRDERLMHVERHRAGPAGLAEVDAAFVQKDGAIPAPVSGFLALVIPPRDVGQAVDKLR